MKILPTLSLQLPEGLRNNLAGLKTVDARIVIRNDPFHAVIDVRGMRVRAHFPDGVPETDFLRLARSGKNNHSLVFRIVRNDANDLKSALSPLLDRIIQSNPHILKDLAFPPHEINLAILLVPPSKRKKDFLHEKTAAVMNRLLAAGFPRESISELIRFLPGGDIASILFSLTGQSSRKKKFSEDIIEDLESFLSKKENNEYIPDMVSLFIQDIDNIINSALPDGDAFVPLQIAQKNDIMILSITLSLLGHLDVLAMKDNDYIHGMVLCDDNGSADILKKSLPDLSVKLIDIGLKADISIEERKNFLIELNERANIIFRERGINIRV